MSIQGLSGIEGFSPTDQAGSTVQPQKSPAEAQTSFKNALNDAITNVNDAQLHSDEMTTKLANGEVDDLHEVMVAAEKASVTLQTTTEVRNKAIEAYQEIMRMQV